MYLMTNFIQVANNIGEKRSEILCNDVKSLNYSSGNMT